MCQDGCHLEVRVSIEPNPISGSYSLRRGGGGTTAAKSTRAIAPPVPGAPEGDSILKPSCLDQRQRRRTVCAEGASAKSGSSWEMHAMQPAAWVHRRIIEQRLLLRSRPRRPNFVTHAAVPPLAHSPPSPTKSFANSSSFHHATGHDQLRLTMCPEGAVARRNGASFMDPVCTDAYLAKHAVTLGTPPHDRAKPVPASLATALFAPDLLEACQSGTSARRGLHDARSRHCMS